MPTLTDRRVPTGCVLRWPDVACGDRERVLTPQGALGWSSRLDGEPKLSEHLDGSGLPALEITGRKALTRGEFVSRAQDRLRRVEAFVPDQIIGRGRSESMLR